MRSTLPYIYDEMDMHHIPKMHLLSLLVRVEARLEPHQLNVRVADDGTCHIIAQGGSPATIAWATATPSSQLLEVFIRADVLGYEQDKVTELSGNTRACNKFIKTHPMFCYTGYSWRHFDATHYKSGCDYGGEIRFKCLGWVPTHTLVACGVDSTLDQVEELLLCVARKSLRAGIAESSEEYLWLQKNFPKLDESIWV